MTPRDRLKQIVTVTLMMVAVSAAAVFMLVRCQRATALFEYAQMAHIPPTYFPWSNPVNNGCPHGEFAIKKDLTIHFFRTMPAIRFDGWIEITAKEPFRVLYRGPYSQTITIRGVCYDDTRPGGNVDLHIALVTKHHLYFLFSLNHLSMRTYSEVEMVFWVYANYSSQSEVIPIR